MEVNNTKVQHKFFRRIECKRNSEMMRLSYQPSCANYLFPIESI